MVADEEAIVSVESVEDKYFVQLPGKATVPYSLQELQQLIAAKEVTRGTSVWKAGLPPWTKAEDIGELKELLPEQAAESPQKEAAPASQPSSSYFVALDGKSAGPFPVNELQTMAQGGRITRASLVWKEGMAQWT
ncbi:MAG: DUF4339 domain-containing protein, partial [Spirochaetaceae bacterium]|nr:DUF4339 domain-containing protein [Spirochaetaceae bacterium]